MNLAAIDRLDVSALPRPNRGQLRHSDLLVLIAQSVVFAIAAALLADAVGHGAARHAIGGTWFQSDGWRVFDDMSQFAANHHRDKVHPLFSISLIPVTNGIAAITGMKFVDVIIALNIGAMVVVCGCLYAAARLVACGVIDALLVSTIAFVSAGTLFWTFVPETYPFGAASIAVCLLVAAAAPRRDAMVVAAIVGSVAFTLTNVVAGAIAAFLTRKPIRAIILGAIALAVAIGIWSIGKAVFPYPGSFFLLPGGVSGEAAYMGHADSGTILDRLAGMLVAPLLAPDFKLLYNQPTGVMFSFQSMAGPTIAGPDPIYLVAVGVALALLALALVAAWRDRSRAAVFLVAVLGAQIVLHLIYGEETFLYAYHFVPLLVGLFALALAGRRRAIARVLAVTLLVLAAANNVPRFIDISGQPFAGTAAYLDRLEM